MRTYSPEMWELIRCPKETLTAAQVQPIVKKDPNTIRRLAREMPERLIFPVLTVDGERTVKIPKWPFLKAYGYVDE